MSLLASLIAFGIGTMPVAPPQDTPRDLRDLVGARAGQAEGDLQRRGYRNVGGEKGDDRSYGYWWNSDRRLCVSIATMEGRYQSIVATPAPDCRQPGPDADRRRTPVPRGRDAVATADLPRFCKGEAASAFDRRPSEITTNLPIRQPNGFVVQGWFEQEKGTRFFTCRFDGDGRFLGVS